MPRRAALVAGALIASLAACQVPAAAESAVRAPAALHTAHEAAGLKTAVFAGGCFWGIEAVFRHVRGVSSAVSGFEGGSAATAHYERVSDGDTGHAEAVKVTYDPARVRYDQLLQVFFSVGADPTQLNRQGPDQGTQYRSALVPLNPEQRAVAADYLAQMAKSRLWKAPIVTRIEPDRGFYPAEDYHQNYLALHPAQPYIVAWDMPKLAALKRLFADQYR